MTIFQLLRAAIFLSINRSVSQIGTIGILSLLGYYNTQLLASFVVLSANFSIFFIIAKSGALILQAEFAKLHQQIAKNTQLLADTLLPFALISCVLCGSIELIDPNFFISEVGTIFDEARQSLPVMALCIPLYTINALLITFMEANGYAKSVSKFQMGETLSMVLLVAIILLTGKASLSSIVFVFIISNIISLIGFVWLMYKKELLHFKHCRLVHIKQLLKPLSISAPSVISQLVAQYGVFILTVTIAKFGAAPSATLSTIFAVVFLSQIMVLGVCQQMIMEIAKQKKAQLPIWPIVKTTSHSLLLIATIVISLLFLAPTTIGQLITNDPKVLPIFTQSIDITILFCLMSFTSIFLSSLLRSLGDYLAQQIIAIIPIIGFIAYTPFIQHSTLSFASIFYLYLLSLGGIITGLIIRLMYFLRTKKNGRVAPNKIKEK